MADIICATCLSKNRKLFLLELVNFFWMDIHFSRGTRVCWECRRLFIKFQAFRDQVMKAQFIYTQTKFQKLENAVSLSTLGITHNRDAFDRFYVTDDVVKEESPPGPDERHFFDVKLEFDTLEASIPAHVVFAEPSTSGNDAGTSKDPPWSYKRSRGKHQVVAAAAVPEPATSEPKDGPANASSSSDSDSEQSSSEWERDLTASSSSAARNVTKNKPPRHFVKNITDDEMRQARLDILNSTKHNNARYKCDKCALLFKLEENYKKHMQRHSADAGNFMCQICEQRFYQMPVAEKHFLDHYRVYQCGECEFTHQQLVVVQRHYDNVHESIRVFPCHLCSEEFLTRRKKKRHVEVVHTEAVKCLECLKTFGSNSNLKLHMMRHKPHPMLECEVCHKHYKGQHNLEIHLRKHKVSAKSGADSAGTDAYCAECDKSFKTRWQYNTHLKYSKAHNDEENFKYQCDDCGRKFYMKCHVEEHIERVHLRLLRYSCDRCDKKFVSARQKRTHVYRIHKMNGVVEKRVSCNTCGKEFVNARTCKIHQTVHTGERPHHCHLCPMRFSQKSTLNTHIKGKHKEVAGLEGWRKPRTEPVG